ncbi:hypothetical protein [Variovorax sp. PBL-E5]|uniref:hypothetical protein n=1 Tax=Variovorax sp. PBL-E5 TaxID=434014 RepID=UPI0013162C58|nr:hypothetical protein [Variovorax sp. PBL-E5]VTU32474.1 hypothetical protein E5CHR_03423 [Variovorax sp. PBL-E5]
MESKLTWPRLMTVWLVLLLSSLFAGAVFIALASALGALLGFGEFIGGVSTDRIRLSGAVIGWIAGLAGHLLALRYTLSRRYRKFDIVFRDKKTQTSVHVIP